MEAEAAQSLARRDRKKNQRNQRDNRNHHKNKNHNKR
jgi:hypothetical protein